MQQMVLVLGYDRFKKCFLILNFAQKLEDMHTIWRECHIYSYNHNTGKYYLLKRYL